MSVRTRRVAVFLPVVVTLVLIAVVGALIIVKNQQNADLVVEADDVGDTFLADIVVFRASVVKAVSGAGTGDPGELRTVVERTLEEAPVLAATSAYGIARSARYAEAQRAERTFLKPYRRLLRELRRADVALDFIARARVALGLRATDYVGFGLLDSSRPVRTRLIPAVVKARDDFAAVRVPEGQELLAATVIGALQHGIDEANALATNIDANRSFVFSYTEEFTVARTAIEDYATVVAGDLTEAINALIDEP